MEKEEVGDTRRGCEDRRTSSSKGTEKTAASS